LIKKKRREIFEVKNVSSSAEPAESTDTTAATDKTGNGNDDDGANGKTEGVPVVRALQLIVVPCHTTLALALSPDGDPVTPKPPTHGGEVQLVVLTL